MFFGNFRANLCFDSKEHTVNTGDYYGKITQIVSKIGFTNNFSNNLNNFSTLYFKIGVKHQKIVLSISK